MSKDKFKSFGLSTWAVNNRKTIFLITFVILIGGMMSYFSMPKENFPEIQIPEIYVGVANPGSSPKFISEKITKPIEKELNSLKNVDEIKSTSVNGFTTIRVKFNFNVTVDKALQKVKDKVDDARSEPDFPDLPIEPNIFEMDPSMMPIMNVNLTGASPEKLKETAEALQDIMEDIQEVSSVNIRGVQTQEMRIDVDPLKAEAVRLSIDDIERAVTSEHVTVSGGQLRKDGTLYSIRIEGEFADAAELKQMIVKEESFKAIRLADVANVYFGNSDTTSYARENGANVVMLDIQKQSGENLLSAAENIQKVLDEAVADRTIPADVKYSITNDLSNNTESMVDDLINSIILGIMLVVGVLLFFLGLRNALFVGVAIPLSMLMSFMILSMMGVSLNVMVLFSLVLSLGMLVDNGIVVVENVYRLMDEDGLDGFTAAKKGVGEVAWPIIASTGTTLAAFIPLALWPGLMGEFMKYLPITLIIVLGSSLFVALVINPVLTAVWMKVGSEKPKLKRTLISFGIALILGLMLRFGGGYNFVGNIVLILAGFILVFYFVLYPGTIIFQNKVLPRIENMYEKFLKRSVSFGGRFVVGFGTVALLIFSFVLMSVFPPKVDFFPQNEPLYANIFVKLPEGTDIDYTNKITLEIEEKVKAILADEIQLSDAEPDTKRKFIQSIISQVGDGTSDPAEGASLSNTPNKARITVLFSEFQFRKGKLTSESLIKLQSLKDYFTADIEISVAKNAAGPPLPPPINIEVKGNKEYSELVKEANTIKGFLERKNIKGVEKLKVDVESTVPEIPIFIDREKVRSLGASTGQVAMAIRKALFGQDIATFKKGDDSYDITARFIDSKRNNFDALLDQKLAFMNNKGVKFNIPLRSVIKTPEAINSYSSVVRKDLIPVVRVYSQVTEGANQNEVVATMKEVMSDYKVKNDGLSFKFTGQQDEQQKEMDFLSKALLIAVFLILIIVVTQFNSFSTPTIIMLAVVFSLIGVLLGIISFGDDFIIMMTMIGIISLAGVVVNNAIVLIDYIDLLRKEKREKLGLGVFEVLPNEEIIDAVIQGGKTRLRPVLLTAITTVLGLIPLAQGWNINFTELLTNGFGSDWFYVGGDNNMFFGPMSDTIIYGLTFATFLTLVFVPVMYIVMFKFKTWIYKIFKKEMRIDL
jgi:multidrug efflux pump subunit AcrB